MRLAHILFACSMVVAAACGGSSSSKTTTTTTTTPTAASDDPSCPVTVPGTSVSVEDTDRGAALVFVTTGDAGEVRKRVEAMASMHNEHHSAMGPLPTGQETGGGHDHGSHGGQDAAGGAHTGHDMGGDAAGGEHVGHDMGGAAGGEHADHAGGMVTVHSQATVEDIDGGTRVVFTSMPDDVAALQSELRKHAQHLSSGTCSMGHH